jgi:cellulose biosynthesis protein BcsQ
MTKIVSLVGPKGGILKTTLIVSMLEFFERPAVLDMDPQANILAWSDERGDNEQLPPESQHKYHVYNGFEFDEIDVLIDDIVSGSEGAKYDFLFLDCPGESIPGEKTRSALSFSDLVLFPFKNANFDMTSFFEHLGPIIPQAKAANERMGRYMLLPTFCHHSSSAEKTIERLRTFAKSAYDDQIDVLPAVSRYRNVFNLFSNDGLTLSEYLDREPLARNRVAAAAAIDDVKKIAKQIKLELSILF